MQRKQVFLILLAGTPAALLACLYAMACFRFMNPELFSTDTVYAPGFDEVRFASLRPGLTPAEVEQVMGPPLEKVRWEKTREDWWYSMSPSSDDFHRRHVIFREGKVWEVVRDFWID